MVHSVEDSMASEKNSEIVQGLHFDWEESTIADLEFISIKVIIDNTMVVPADPLMHRLDY